MKMMEDSQQIQEYTLQLLEENDVSFTSFSEFRKHIIQRINEWINNDFEHLLFMLYRIDVHEDKVRKLMAAHKGENAAEVIADLIIERQKQKIETRKLFHMERPADVDDSELW
jgi:iron-sulfur cluster repair protein YtfE (RIC family)